MKNLYFIIALISTTLFATPVFASDTNWHQKTESYSLYLGIVPASKIKKNPVLIDNDKKMHGDIGASDGALQHIMIALYDTQSNKRITNATIIAKLSKKKVFNKNVIYRPLEKMNTSGVTTYGNFFPMKEKGVYQIELDVYTSDGSTVETTSFQYKR